MTTSTETITFQTGARYSCRSICNHDCIWTFEVLRRTAKTVWLRDVDNGKEVRRRVRTYTSNGETFETCEPLGGYSMSPTIWANQGEIAR